jgi:hypothetical protein
MKEKAGRRAWRCCMEVNNCSTHLPQAHGGHSHPLLDAPQQAQQGVGVAAGSGRRHALAAVCVDQEQQRRKEVRDWVKADVRSDDGQKASEHATGRSQAHGEKQ